MTARLAPILPGASPQTLDLSVVELAEDRKHVLIDRELSAFCHGEHGRAFLDDPCRYLLDLFRIDSELLRLLLDEARLELGLLFEGGLRFVGDASRGGGEELGGTLRMLCGIVAKFDERILSHG